MKTTTQSPGCLALRTRLNRSASHAPVPIRHSSFFILHSSFPFAFTLIEILVTMAMLSFIVLGLLATFNQVQRAFTSAQGQTDFHEASRAAIGLMVQDLEQMAAVNAPPLPFNADPTALNTMNFFAIRDQSPNLLNGSAQYVPLPEGAPTTWPYQQRINLIQKFFVLTKANLDWVGIGYQVIPDSPGSAVGSLYRFTITNGYRLDATGHVIPAQRYPPYNFQDLMSADFSKGLMDTTNRIADGVVHLRLVAYDTNGVPFSTYTPQFNTSPSYGRGVLASSPPWNYNSSALPAMLTNASAISPTRPYRQPADPSDCYFWGNALPAYVELEFGILEPKTAQHYRAAIANGAAAATYLSNHVAQVHVFRQRIAIRNVDFTAYQPLQ